MLIKLKILGVFKTYEIAESICDGTWSAGKEKCLELRCTAHKRGSWKDSVQLYGARSYPISLMHC